MGLLTSSWAGVRSCDCTDLERDATHSDVLWVHFVITTHLLRPNSAVRKHQILQLVSGNAFLIPEIVSDS